MAWLDKLHHPEKFIKTFLKWGLLGLIMGILGGLIGAGFHHALHFVTHVRGENTWLIFLLLSHSIMSDSLRSHGLQPIRHLCSWGFSRQEDWSGLPFPPPGDLPKPGVEPRSPALQVDCVPSKPPATMEGLILYSSLKFGHWPQSSGLVASSAFSEGLEPLV